MGGYSLPPGWSVVPSPAPSPAPSASPGGFALPAGWSLMDSQGGESQPPVPRTGMDAPNSGWLQSALRMLLTANSAAGQAPAEYGKGALIGAGRTAMGLGDLIAGNKAGTTADAFGMVPQGVAQQMGAASEGILETAAPGAAAAKAPLLARIAVEGGANALSAAARGQDPKLAAAIGAAGPALPAVASGLKKAGEWTGGRLVNSVIKPLEKEFRFGRNPGEGVATEGIVAKSLPDLAEKVGAKLDEVGGLISKRLNTPAAQRQLIDIRPLLKPIDEAIGQAVRVGDTALAQRLKEITDAPIFTETPLATPAQAAEIKTLIGKATRWTGEAFEKDINQARAAVYRNLNNAIDEAVPGVKALNARYANLLGAVKSAERQMSIQARQAPLNLMDVVSGGAGAFGLAGQDDDPITRIGKGVGAAMMRRGLSSTPAMSGAGAAMAAGGSLSPWLLQVLRALASGVRPATPGSAPQQTPPQPR